MDQIQEIKKRIDIVDFLGRYINLKKAGRNFKANCPFHQEKSASFVISPERQIWHCFGACAEGGDVIKFLMKWESITFPEAVTILAKQAGIELKEFTQTDSDYREKERLYGINALAADFYQYILEKLPVAESAREYLKTRTVNDKLARTFYIGYAPNSWDSLVKFLNKKGYSNDIIIKAGLAVLTKRGTAVDRFRGRLMFPLYDTRGNVVGFSGRILTPGEKEAKYVNSPETPIYHKREHLFGLYQTKDNIRKENEIILVEGEFDALLCYEHGFSNVVAIKGSALTPDHLRLIKRFTNKIVFALDMDAAGNDAVKRGITEAERFEFEMHVIEVPEGKDPADSLSTNPSLFKTAYKHKISIYEFVIEQGIAHQNTDDIYGKKRIVDEVTPYLQHIGNPIVRDYYTKFLANKLELPIESVIKAQRDLWRKKKQNSTAGVLKDTKKTNRREELIEDYLCALLVQTKEQEKILKLIDMHLKNNYYFTSSTGTFIDYVREAWQSDKSNFQQALEERVPAELTDLYNRSYLLEFGNEKGDHGLEAERIVLEIKKHSLKRQLHTITEEQGDQFQEIMSSLKEVEKKLNIL